MEETTRIAELIKRFIDESLTERERTELNEWTSKSDENQSKFFDLTQRNIVVEKLEQFEKYDVEKSWVKLELQCLNEETQVVPIRSRRWIKWVAAASVIVLVAGYFLIKRETSTVKPNITQTDRFKNDVSAPVSNNATLTLADGSVIVLDSVGNGQLATDGRATIKKEGDVVSYEVPRFARDDNRVVYNTITVPKGSKPVQLVLADRSQVWLDAATTITYPTAFVSNERRVKMNGQAYFEVAHNSAMPFRVEKGDLIVEVLGTHFNVKAFDDEEMKVTLLEGSVKVSRYGRDDKSVIIKPGQQAQVPRDARDDKGAIVVTTNINVDEVMAWKNGMFNFNGARIETIMKEVGRWYDVEVVFEYKPSDEFVAPISRDVPVSKLLKLLELTNKVHFKIEGRKVTVVK